MSQIKLSSWDYDKNELVVEAEVSVSTIARSLDLDKFVELFSTFLNLGGKDFSTGKLVGKALQSDHPTLQGLAIRFCLGVIIGLSGQKYTDARNEVPVEMADKIAEMLENKELKMGYMI